MADKPLLLNWPPSRTEDWALDPGEYETVIARLPQLTPEEWAQLRKEDATPAAREQQAWAAQQQKA